MKVLKRALCAAAATALLATGAFAADLAPLAPGKPAGTRQALLAGPSTLVLIGLAVIVTGVVVAVSDNGGKNVTTPTTGTGA